MINGATVSGEEAHSESKNKESSGSTERKSGSNQTICWIVYTIFLFIICYVSMRIFPSFKFIKLETPCQSYTLEITAIVLSAISAFIAILIPLHYSIVLDIVQQIIDPKTNNEYEVKALKIYVATSDIIIAITAIFGISSLLAGAIAMAVHFQIIPENNSYLKAISFVYLILINASFARSICLMRNSKLAKNVDNKINKFYFVYIIWLLLAGIISICWARSLYHFKMPHHNALGALIVLALFYLMWLFLKLPFIPINRIERLYKNES